ncbi:uncharacterized protein LOC134807506 [Pan troglodytes]|uniref:uncharacterized protein LOC134807506 n=1 Tax=Pan troglodytes TaxID=9598 RepID=UPI00301330C0
MTAAPAFFPPQVPWEDLCYLFDEIMYGGHITDDGDCKLCRVYLEEFMNPSLLAAMSGTHACGEKPRLPANSHVSEPSWKWILQPQSSLQMTAALANILTATS